MDEEEAAAVSHKFNILKYGQKLFYFILLDTLEFYIHKLVELDDINVKEISFFPTHTQTNSKCLNFISRAQNNIFTKKNNIFLLLF